MTVVGSLVGNSPSGAAMTVDRANLVYDPKAVNLSFDLQFSGLGQFSPVNGGFQLVPGSQLTPGLLFENGKFREPTQTELQQGLLFRLPGRPASRWDELTLAEQGSNALRNLLEDARNTVVPQIEKWNQDNLNPQTLNAKYHLDLNRFVKIQNSMKILTRRLDHN